jgi:CheY-like chemotaxis protein
VRYTTAFQAVVYSKKLETGVGMRILVAEDDDTLRTLVDKSLRRLGHTVRGVRDGDEALQCLEHEFFDTLLTDIKMPICDGMTLIHVLREQLDCPIHIVAMSAEINADIDRYLGGLGIETLHKPFTIGELKEAVDRSCKGPQTPVVTVRSGSTPWAES